MDARAWADEFDRAAREFPDCYLVPVRSEDGGTAIVPRFPDGCSPTVGEIVRDDGGPYVSVAMPGPYVGWSGEMPPAADTRLGYLWRQAARDLDLPIDDRKRDFGAVDWVTGQGDWFHKPNWLDWQEQAAFNPFSAVAVLLRRGPKGEAGRGKPTAKINDRMLGLLQSKPECKGWTARQFAAELKCSPSAITDTKSWQELAQARDLLKVEKAKDRQRGRRALKR